MDSAHLARRLQALVGPGAWDVRYGQRAGAPVIEVQLTRAWSFPVGVPPDDLVRSIAADLKLASPAPNPTSAWPHPSGFLWNTTRSSVTYGGVRLEGVVWPSYVRLAGTSPVGRWEVSVRDCELTPEHVRWLSEPRRLVFRYAGAERVGMAVLQQCSRQVDPVTGERGFVEFHVPVSDARDGL